jgi:multiple sugar transport system permease protein
MSDRQLALVMLAPALAVISFYLIYPLATIVSSSVSEWPSPIDPGPWVGFANFQSLIQGQDLLPSLARSVFWTVGNDVVQILAGLGIALLLNLPLRGRGIARVVVLVPFVVPAVVLGLLWRNILDELVGVVSYVLISAHIVQQPISFLSSPTWSMDTIILISAWKFTPFVVILVLARLQSVPIQLLEAARSDGASAWQVFRYVTLPWLAPVLVIALMLRTIWGFNDFDVPFLLTQGGPNSSTTTLPILIRQLLLEQLNPGMAAALSLFMIAILVLLGLGFLMAYRRAEAILRG